jgi:hypothetical protein
MGSGGPRDLEVGKELPDLDEGLAVALTKALNALDGIDGEFKSAREEERQIQLVKIWGKACKQVDLHLVTLCDVLNASHQVSLEPGSSGGGRNISPWVMESNDRFDRLEIKLVGETVTATAGPHTVAKCPLGEETYAWLERLLVKWMVASVKLKL